MLLGQYKTWPGHSSWGSDPSQNNDSRKNIYIKKQIKNDIRNRRNKKQENTRTALRPVFFLSQEPRRAGTLASLTSWQGEPSPRGSQPPNRPEGDLTGCAVELFRGHKDMAVVVNTNGTILVGRCSAHSRTCLSGDWDVHGGYGILTHGHMITFDFWVLGKNCPPKFVSTFGFWVLWQLRSGGMSGFARVFEMESFERGKEHRRPCWVAPLMTQGGLYMNPKSRWTLRGFPFLQFIQLKMAFVTVTAGLTRASLKPKVFASFLKRPKCVSFDLKGP